LRRLAWVVAACLVGIAPSLATVVSVRALYALMARVGLGGTHTADVLLVLQQVLRPPQLALGVSALLSLALGLALLARPALADTGLAPGFSLAIALAASVPPLLLWFTESLLLGVILGTSNRVSDISSTARNLALLLAATMAAAVVATCFPIAASTIALAVGRRAPTSRGAASQAIAWLLAAVWLAAMAAAFHLRAASIAGSRPSESASRAGHPSGSPPP
jgi:hypothetical protein